MLPPRRSPTCRTSSRQALGSARRGAGRRRPVRRRVACCAPRPRCAAWRPTCRPPRTPRSALVRSIFDGQGRRGLARPGLRRRRRRWTATRDLADALEHLSEVAVVRSAGNDVLAGRRRAFAIDAGRAGQPRRCATRCPTRHARSTTGPAWSTGCSAARRSPATVTLVKQSLAGGYRTVTVALEEYQKVAAAVQDERVAEVRTAQPLADADRERLGAGPVPAVRPRRPPQRRRRPRTARRPARRDR